MAAQLLGFITLLIFCISCQGLIRSLSANSKWAGVKEYSQVALKVERKYKIFAWGLLTFVIFIHLVVSFLEVLSAHF